ncbi:MULTISPECIES: YiiD C-terminal domain-containing protein [unclassified Anaeromyxobacter]|uniref:YiiD C-terminal domain-containing protein n=1 Tax=unclassified Anaeromyxobacter TaxID=2620896 RepID=UPI001F55C1AD|nr:MULTISPECIES: YiiD C-terminal domain-containing protein [unclassified Anaeromyxobacter]
MTRDEITRYVREHIPLAVHLGAVIERYDGASLRLAAPLAPSLNHRSTAFGGSLSAIAILSGWTLVHLNLRERGVEAGVVIQRSEVSFDEPVAGDFFATSTLPPAAEWERFLETLRRHRRARVTVRGAVEAGSRRGGTFENVYVATRDGPPVDRARR